VRYRIDRQDASIENDRAVLRIDVYREHGRVVEK
jgi:hypothetical protein